MREVSVKLKNKNGEDVLYEGVTTVSLDGEDGTKKSFAFGDLTTGVITLDFSQGDQQVVAPDDELYDKVTIQKPATFLAENIAKDVVIAGVTGTFEGKQEMATLYTPSISRSSDTISISNPSSNGSFVQRYKIYQQNAETPDFSTTSSSFSLIGRYAAEHDYKIVATCHSNLMNESSRSGVIQFSIYSVRKELGSHLSTTDTTSKISNGLAYSLTVSSSFGYWLPENIEVYVKENGSDEYVLSEAYEYSMYTGKISISSMVSNVKIVAAADEEPILKRPEVIVDSDAMTVTTEFPRYSEHLQFYDGDTLFYTKDKDVSPVSVAVSHFTTYYFVLNDDGYYKPTNRGYHSSYAISRITFTNTGPEATVKLNWMQSSEQNYDYGMVGQMDTALSQSTSVDSNLLLNAYGRTATSPQALTLTVPNGTHFYDVKYRKDGSVSSGWDMFEFSLDLGETVSAIASDNLYGDVEYLLSAYNDDYKNKKSANVTHHFYVDDTAVYQEKEGI